MSFLNVLGDVLVAQAQQADRLKNEALAKIQQLISALPENDGITQLSESADKPQLFTTKRSQLSHGLVMSPEFYHFRTQYEAIVEKLQGAEDWQKRLTELLSIDSTTRSAIWLDGTSRNRRLRLHPQVVENIQQLFPEEYKRIQDEKNKPPDEESKVH